MSSRLSIDSTTLKIRDVYCLNPTNADYIQAASIPVIGNGGKLKWLSSLEFLSTISVPTLSTNIFDLLTSIQTGASSFSTIIPSTIAASITSTVTGLGTLGYVSTSQLNRTVDFLSLDHGYISSTTLYDCFTNLADMHEITFRLGPMAMFLGGSLSNLSGGYVSTINPGEYRIYKSTIGLQGNNYTGTMVSGGSVASGNIGLAGFQTNIVNTSHMRIDINANIQLNYASGSGLTTFSTFLVNPANSRIIGDPVRLTFNSGGALLTNLSFLLNSNQLTPFPANLEIHHAMVGSNGSANLVTNIPEIGGIFVTLDNTD